MRIVRMVVRGRALGVAVGLLALLWLLGCSVAGLGPFTAPPEPRPGQTRLDPFYVQTPNYFFLYTDSTGPFSFGSQFGDGHYPVPVAYEGAAGASGFNVRNETEACVETLADADPRVSIISGVGLGQDRIRVGLVSEIEYNDIPNIIGLTKLTSGGGNPRFTIYVTTVDPITGTAMSQVEMEKTLTHELGHAFGLGHSPDSRDLMYYRANGMQGATPRSFVTYGDAIALWTTLNSRHVSWISSRPTVSSVARAEVRGEAKADTEEGVVIDVYAK